MDSQYCVREVILPDDTNAFIDQEIESDVGGVVWDSSLVAVYYFLKQGRNFWKNKNVLELGAGTGVCGIVLASLGALVSMTDLPDRVSLLERNTNKNLALTGQNIKSFSLDWTNYNRDAIGNIDVVVFIDCIYYRDGVKPLIDLLKDINAPESYCIYEKRDIGEPAKAQKLFLDLIVNFFDITFVKEDELDSLYACHEIPVLRLCPKTIKE